MSTQSTSTSDGANQNAVRLEPWSEDDLALDLQLLGDPEMTRYLGGPESAEHIAQRHAYKLTLPDSGAGRMFKIVLQATGEAVGSVGYWQNSWHEENIYEIGWLVLTAFQGRGIASAATAQAIVQAKADGKHRFLHAFPSVENGPSNGICQKLGFTLVEAFESEYPKGHFMQCNDWRLDLSRQWLLGSHCLESGEARASFPCRIIARSISVSSVCACPSCDPETCVTRMAQPRSFRASPS